MQHRQADSSSAMAPSSASFIYDVTFQQSIMKFKSFLWGPTESWLQPFHHVDSVAWGPAFEFELSYKLYTCSMLSICCSLLWLGILNHLFLLTDFLSQCFHTYFANMYITLYLYPCINSLSWFLVFIYSSCTIASIKFGDSLKHKNKWTQKPKPKNLVI